jgi:hypothetical protein
MHTCASFDAAKDERTNINAEAIVTGNRASKYTRARGKFKNLPESNRARLRARGRRGDCQKGAHTPVHPTSISGEMTLKKAIPSRQTNQEAQLTVPE